MCCKFKKKKKKKVHSDQKLSHGYPVLALQSTCTVRNFPFGASVTPYIQWGSGASVILKIASYSDILNLITDSFNRKEPLKSFGQPPIQRNLDSCSPVILTVLGWSWLNSSDFHASIFLPRASFMSIGQSLSVVLRILAPKGLVPRDGPCFHSHQGPSSQPRYTLYLEREFHPSTQGRAHL